ncbi:helix-turn-helix domain-containing protein [Streptacidiphilus sp. ASG 303]|uniref:IclR family transcriptional regulator n=1 Tax=Streptacidiphilus sp. ASG 303 TaxID=2896847 RepID=UPI001E2AD7EA|nr:IclR family transcriptional regulator C-terminal domain-containing protein [Streptacidiphilus sp. ASG 303]MCD0481451.1 helix-turn-helix domain-containing protein [Streptacidiphilus sp. ASG 303]
MTLHDVRPVRRGSLHRALRLLEAVDRHRDGVTTDALARELGLPVAAVDRTAAELEDHGYLQRLDRDAYVLGGTLVRLAGRTRRDTLRDRLDTALRGLRDELGAAVHLGAYRDGEAVVEASATAPWAPGGPAWVDPRAAAHATALGKCLLAQLDDRARRDHLDRHPPVRLTSRTTTDPGQLLQRLDRQPATMPVLDLQEYALGTVCAAVPLTAGSTAACLAVSLPLDQAYRLRRAADVLADRTATVLLSLAL